MGKMVVPARYLPTVLYKLPILLTRRPTNSKITPTVAAAMSGIIFMRLRDYAQNI